MLSFLEKDKEAIEKSLKLWNFNMNEIPIDLVQYVPMHNFKVSSNEKPLLYVDNLQCCVALFAYAPNFGFASHINTVVMRGRRLLH